ncbi:MAG: hypothetical protein RJQ14_00835, partial [Marinoscillum sp.]
MSDLPKDTDRRSFVRKVSAGIITGGTLGLAACKTEDKKSININFNNSYRWKMTTTWPPNFPVVGEGCKMMA